MNNPHLFASGGGSRFIMRRGIAVLSATATLMLASCTSNDSSSDTTASNAGTTATTSAPATSASEETTATTATSATEDTEASATTEETTAATETTAAPTGPSPGVTDDAIKIGITYVDTEALKAVGLNYDLGDHQAVYQALIDDINSNGGINGRMLEPFYAPVDPTSTQPAEAACLKLTEDEDVFLITGFFLADAVLCPLEAHETAVVGGAMTPEWLERAKAPWAAWLADTDQPLSVVQTFFDRGELSGKVAVFAAARDIDLMNNQVLPLLEENGVVPVETGILDAPADDVVALQANVKLLAEKFKSAGADTILLIGASAASWPVYMADDPTYRPKLLFTELTAPRAFWTSADTTDTSVLEGALAGGGYGPDQARYDEPAMQACVEILTAAGVAAPPPSDFSADDPSNQPYQAAFQACPDIALTRALLEAAGETLNYGSLTAAQNGLKIVIPGDPTERTYGPPPDADGDPTAYIFAWDESIKNMVVDNG